MTRENRIKLAKKMDEIVRSEFNDERWIMDWLSLGVPDEATEEDYEWYGDEPEEFDDLVSLFITLVGEELADEYD